MVNATPVEVIMAAASAVTGMWGLGIAMIGYWYTNVHWFVRIISFIAGLMLIDPGLLTDVIGIVLLIGIYFIQSNKLNTQKKIAA